MYAFESTFECLVLMQVLYRLSAEQGMEQQRAVALHFLRIKMQTTSYLGIIATFFTKLYLKSLVYYKSRDPCKKLTRPVSSTLILICYYYIHPAGCAGGDLHGPLGRRHDVSGVIACLVNDGQKNDVHERHVTWSRNGPEPLRP